MSQTQFTWLFSPTKKPHSYPNLAGHVLAAGWAQIAIISTLAMGPSLVGKPPPTSHQERFKHSCWSYFLLPTQALQDKTLSSKVTHPEPPTFPKDYPHLNPLSILLFYPKEVLAKVLESQVWRHTPFRKQTGESEASMIYRVSSWIATQRNPVSKSTKKIPIKMLSISSVNHRNKA